MHSESGESTTAVGPGTAKKHWVEYEKERCADPRGYFARLRSATPIDYVEGHEGWPQVLRRRDVENALRNPKLFSSDNPTLLGGEIPAIPFGIDQPQHTMYRKLLDPLFSPRRIAELEPRVVAGVNDLIDSFVGNGSVEFTEDFAVPLPCRVFLDLLGISSEHLPRLLVIKDKVIRPHKMTDDPGQVSAMRDEGAADAFEFFAEQLRQRRAEPTGDLLGHFTTAEVDGRPLTEVEQLAMCFMFMLAGLDTVTGALTAMFAFLSREPEYQQLLANEPGTVPNAVEELLRWESTVMGVPRKVTEDTEIGGCPLKQGQMIDIMLASANLAAEAAPGADRLDLRRGDKRHLAFGGGPHRCLGSHLARMELRVALREWHRRIPEYRLAPGAEVVYNGSGLRAVDELPLVWDLEENR